MHVTCLMKCSEEFSSIVAIQIRLVMAPLDFLTLHVVKSYFQALPLMFISLVWPSFTLISLGLDKAAQIKSQYLKPNSSWTIILYPCPPSYTKSRTWPQNSAQVFEPFSNSGFDPNYRQNKVVL